ncbi:MAG: sulfatase-like hydrolase/transferase [Candidatus Aminicenantes bacterium]|jgi:arylsulfatase A-like enzyme/predicted Zn-dependent protease
MNIKKQNHQQPVIRRGLWLGTIAALVLAVVVFIIFLLTNTTKKDISGKCRDLNLMVITLDTTRADRIGAYGYQPAETPNIDGLAANGILFENCYATVPITLPSHSSLFTGRYPLGHQVRDNGTFLLEKDEITLAEKMKEQGFQTFAVIAAYVLLARFGLNQGFDLYDDSLEVDVILKNYRSEIKADQVYAKFSRWFKKIDPPKKFFTWIHFYDPHSPYDPPEEYKKKWGGNPITFYDGEVAFVDKYVGKIIADLKNANLLEQTLVVIVGDHGEAFGEHKEYGHAIFCYEQNLKVPMVFYNSRVFTGKLKGLRVKDRVCLIDVMPTILELYGQEIPGEIQGQSFAHLITGDSEKKERTFYIESMHGKEEMGWAPLTGIIHEQYKYISLPEPELYDLTTDRNEKDNLFWKKNRLARDLDKRLMNLVARYSTGGKTGETDSRRQLTEDDTKHLQTLGYISAFSNKANTNLDPKKGVIFDKKFNEIDKAITQGDLDLAETHLQEIMKDSPKIQFPQYFEMMMTIYRKRNDMQNVIRFTRQAVAAFPQITNFKVTLAQEYFNTNLLEEADKTAAEVIQAAPTETRAYILRGRIAEKKDRIPEALGYFEKALALEPQNVSLKVSYAKLLAKNKNYLKAGEICRELLANPEVSKDPTVKTKLGVVLVEIHQDDLGYKVLTEVKESNNANAEMWNYLGIFYFRKKQYQQALPAYQESIKLDPDVAETYNNLGALYLTIFLNNRDRQMRDQAINAFNQALALDPKLVSALNGRGSAYKFGKRIRDALNDWNKVIAIKPGFTDAYFNIGITYLQINQKKEALKYLNLLKNKFYHQLPPRDQQRLERLILQAGG